MSRTFAHWCTTMSRTCSRITDQIGKARTFTFERREEILQRRKFLIFLRPLQVTPVQPYKHWQCFSSVHVPPLWQTKPDLPQAPSKVLVSRSSHLNQQTYFENNLLHVLNSFDICIPSLYKYHYSNSMNLHLDRLLQIIPFISTIQYFSRSNELIKQPEPWSR